MCLIIIAFMYQLNEQRVAFAFYHTFYLLFDCIQNNHKTHNHIVKFWINKIQNIIDQEVFEVLFCPLVVV